MLIVTGGAGFIGSNIVKSLNKRGERDIAVVDNLHSSAKFKNLVSCDIADYMDKLEFRKKLESNELPWKPTAIFHQGACSDTMEYDGRYMMDNNFTYSKLLLDYALKEKLPFIYASSAAVYGDSDKFAVSPENERPLNIYGYSKLLFDNYVRRQLPNAESTVVGLRYFNVYGPGEAHKGRMASVIFQLDQQLAATGRVKLFGSGADCAAGEHCRDFVHVDDLVKMNLHFLDCPGARGIVNAGTGHAQSFNELARTLISLRGKGEIEYIPFPPALSGKYQSFTQADLTELRLLGYSAPSLSLAEGMVRYLSTEA